MENDGRSMRERMLAGDPYLADDPELGELHLRAMDLVAAYNPCSARDPREQRRRAAALGRVGRLRRAHRNIIFA
ncbi:maltose acetyltransferase domain-containing protein [Virgisporangium ochraceum]|uniref:Maltose/galactoside acetyltransferase domain-containing protein n=1 Tax=Virgisporangium ochraceum TaxID=65505 RepID=A0A8J4A2T9_9ACTN|nr:maltose acetyltransferase domain-containing protein [Virgisporangium ochraceum]GIJ71751.1 hypothetical protein Voc01_066680 [Virgisporangium ochraceum]